MRIFKALGLFAAFAAVTGCQKPEAESSENILGSHHQFDVDVASKTVELRSGANKVTYDFDANIVTTQRGIGGTRKSFSLSDPSLSAELTLYRNFSEGLLCGERDQNINGHNHVTYSAGCSSNAPSTRKVTL